MDRRDAGPPAEFPAGVAAGELKITEVRFNRPGQNVKEKNNLTDINRL
jgi:hypothetical protein